MQHEAAGAVARARGAPAHHDRRAFGIGARDRIDEIERACAIGDDRNADTRAVARDRVRRETDRRLVAQREVRQDLRSLDDLVERQHEIARNSEDLARAVVLQRLQESGGERGHGRELQPILTNAPPSTGNATPVMKLALARNNAALATSQAVPIFLRNGTWESRIAATSARLLPE